MLTTYLIGLKMQMVSKEFKNKIQFKRNLNIKNEEDRRDEYNE